MPEIVWKAGAEADLLEIFAALEGSRSGAGEKFVLAVDSVLSLVKEHPRLAPVYDLSVRRLLIRNTSFGLFYTVEARGIIIHALVHLRQGPERIRAKIRRLFELE